MVSYEVFSSSEANYVVVLSEAFGLKRVIKRIWFNLPEDKPMNNLLLQAAELYGEYISPNIRIDIYKTRAGRAYGVK